MPTVSVKDQDAFAADQRAPVDQLLSIIYALLGLAVIIAVLGIVNTLALSVIERTREVGLLRAVGMSRRQLRTMIRLESVAISVLGEHVACRARADERRGGGQAHRAVVTAATTDRTPVRWMRPCPAGSGRP